MRAKFVRASSPEAILATVIDDRRMFVSGPQSVEQLERVVRRTREYDADTGMVMKKVARELGIRHASIETQVGYQVAFQKITSSGTSKQACQKTMRTVLRVAQLPPLFSERKQNLLRSATYPQNIYGTELGPPSKAVKILLEQAIPSVFTHRTNTQRSKHVCFAFLIKRH